MLRREESATTYMGMGIAIPHGTSDAKKCVLHSGIVVLQYPGGVAFGDEKAYLVVGIAGVGTPIWISWPGWARYSGTKNCCGG